jgi:hypothetical protein
VVNVEEGAGGRQIGWQAEGKWKLEKGKGKKVSGWLSAESPQTEVCATVRCYNAVRVVSVGGVGVSNSEECSGCTML